MGIVIFPLPFISYFNIDFGSKVVCKSTLCASAISNEAGLPAGFGFKLSW
jgi:hypothetical protein